MWVRDATRSRSAVKVQVRTEVQAELSISFMDLRGFCFFLSWKVHKLSSSALETADGGGGWRLALVILRGWQFAYFLPCRKGSGLGSPL